MRINREFELNDDDFQFFVKLVREKTGIVLGDHKREMLYGRLARRLRSLGLDNFVDYRARLTGAHGSDELAAMVNAVTTNLTKFFRESHHFDHIRDVVVPDFMAKVKQGGRPKLRIWSAGCSSGQEPYSTAMTLRGAIPDIDRYDIKILATDLDTNILAVGQSGRYRAEEAESIPSQYRRYVSYDNNLLVMSPDLRRMITFNQLNLLGDWPIKGPFDVIFCRNVVIYFDKPTQTRLYDRFNQLMTPESWLYVGHSEVIGSVTNKFETIGKSIYRQVTR